jgi:hypothetical protein
MKPTLVTETSEEKTQTPGKSPEESTLVPQCGENLKTYIIVHLLVMIKNEKELKLQNTYSTLCFTEYMLNKLF